VKKSIIVNAIIISALVPLLSLGGTASGQQFDSGFGPQRALFVAHGDLDPTTGDLLLISNSWHNSPNILRRFNADGKSDRDFVQDRYESCCAIHPALVTVDKNGSIYTLEYGGALGGFYVYKHAPSGELDVDWGQREGTIAQSDLTSLSDALGSDNSQPDTGSEDSFEEGETSLDWNRGGGRLHFFFSVPVDLHVRSDGSLLVLDQGYRYVYVISPDGSNVSEFIGAQEYYPVRPQRMVMDSSENIYIVDSYDQFDFNRAYSYGVFKFDSSGKWIMDWGDNSGGINDEWRKGLDLTTMVLDGSDNLIVLGSGFNDGGHSEVFLFDTENGDEVSNDNLQFRLGFDSRYLGILGRLDSGFIVLDEFGFEIDVNYYTTDGIREKKVVITDLYDTEYY